MEIVKNCAFLSYMANAYAPGDICFCALSIGDREPIEISLSEVTSFPHQIITYDLPLITAVLKDHELLLPANMVDVEQAGRLIIGHSHNEYRERPPWTIWKLLEYYFYDKAQLEHVRNWCYRTEVLPEKCVIMSFLFEISRRLSDLWRKLLLDLEQKGELHRFLNIEIPVNAILLRRQYEGIRIDSGKLSARLDILDNIIAHNSQTLRAKWGIIDVTDIKALSEPASDVSYAHLSSIISESDPNAIIETPVDMEGVVQVYEEIKKSMRDKNILLRFGAVGETRIYPIFEGMGTVTGRVLMKNPAIQQLKKSSRDIITSDEGYRLLYPDFKQFEPGILADDSGDPDLTVIYNSGGIYNALSIVLFGDEKHRKEAKLLFLAFSYGMTKSKLSMLVNDLTDKKLENGHVLIEKFFGRFSTIEKWKEALCSELLDTGRIGTRDGNYRYRKNRFRKSLSDIEKRWVVSQRIQGSASLICKRCMLRVDRELPEAQFLIPMHDAILYQVPSESIDIARGKIENIFIDEYRLECKSIVPRVSFEPFWVDE